MTSLGTGNPTKIPHSTAVIAEAKFSKGSVCTEITRDNKGAVALLHGDRLAGIYPWAEQFWG